MTVCIAVLCNNAEDVVVASDRMITATYPPVEFEHGMPKLEVICSSCIVLTAGDALAHADICRAVREIVVGLSHPKAAAITEHVRTTYVTERQKVINQRFLEPRGWTLEDFYEKYARVIHPDLMLTVDRQISTYDYGLEIIVAGVDSDEAHIYGIRHPGEADCYDALGYHAIGIGDLHAISSLITNKCIPSVSRKMAVYLTYEAKKSAENAPGVGQETDMVIVSKDGQYPLSSENLTLLDKIHEERRVPRTEEFTKAVEELPF